MDNETLLVLLNERVENLKLQMARLISHFESEQRHSVRHGKDIDKLLLRMDAMEKAMDKKEQNWQYWVSIGVSIVAIGISIFKG